MSAWAGGDNDDMTASPSAQQRSILITGAASGIGLATARLFESRGWRLGCFDVNQRGLDELATALDPTAAQIRQLDVTDRDAVLGAFETFGDWTEGRLDLLFNNAGIDAKGPFETMTWDQIMSIVNVNLVGGLSVIHAGIPLLRRTENSLCLSTSSASAIFGAAQLAVYSATKHAIKGLTEALSVELARHNVRAMDILPAIVDTGMLPPELKAILPTEGTFRPLAADDVAEVVWQAYHGDKLHWYVPAELAVHAVRATTEPETTRDERIAGKLF